MRIKHNLWKVNNGWLLVPENVDGYLHSNEAQECVVFKTLKEFAEWKPKRVRWKRTTTGRVLQQQADRREDVQPQHTKD